MNIPEFYYFTVIHCFAQVQRDCMYQIQKNEIKA